MSSNGVIGRNNALPWRLAGDLSHFKRVTLGKPVLMGRKTWESIGRPLPGRANIVITRQDGYVAEGAQVVKTFDEAVELATGIAGDAGAGELMVIGGAEIYRLALPRAARLYVTEVHAEVEGDTFFPAWDRSEWTEVDRQRAPTAAGDTCDYSFVVYERHARK
jgi:dihydrofolate reductase